MIRYTVSGKALAGFEKHWEEIDESRISRFKNQYPARATVELCDGAYSPFQLQKMVNTPEILETARELLDLTYEHQAEDLPDIINEYLSQLPGGNDWKLGSQK